MSTAVATKPKTELAQQAAPKTIREILTHNGARAQIAQALPKHCTADRFLRIVSNCIRRIPKLEQCDQTSFFNALLTLSQYGLEPDGRNAHLIPFRNNAKNITECQLIIDYKGLVELAMRSGQISNIHADIVCENDQFEYDTGEIKFHKVDFRNPRGAMYAAYARVKFKDGSVVARVMTKADIDAIRKRSKAGSSGPWVTDYNEMAKKTVFRNLSKWISISAEFRDALDHDDDKLDLTPAEPTRLDSLAEQYQSTDSLTVEPTETNRQHECYAAHQQLIRDVKSGAEASKIRDAIEADIAAGNISVDEGQELLEALSAAME